MIFAHTSKFIKRSTVLLLSLLLVVTTVLPYGMADYSYAEEKKVETTMKSTAGEASDKASDRSDADDSKAESSEDESTSDANNVSEDRSDNDNKEEGNSGESDDNDKLENDSDSYNKEPNTADIDKSDNSDDSAETSSEEKSEEADDSSKNTLRYDGKDYDVVLTYDDKAGIPDGAELTSEEVTKKENRKEYNKYLDEVKSAIKAAQAKDKKAPAISFVKFFDITIENEEGKEVEPDALVDVTMKYGKNMSGKMTAEDKDCLTLIHLTRNENTGKLNAEIIDEDKKSDDSDYKVDFKTKNDKLTQVDFTTDSFSVYAVVYTVDFHFGDGTYDFSIAGDSSILLSDVLKKLHINDFELTDVLDVKFSDPSLIKVEKAASSKEDAAKASTDREHDWLLTSLKPFDSQEKLTIELPDGHEIEIIITDERKAKEITQAELDEAVSGSISFPEVIKEPSNDEKSVLSSFEFAGEKNNDSEQKDLIWKQAQADFDANSVSITLAYFQKRFGSKIDFIFCLDETGTMGANATVNGHTHTRAEWARMIAVKASQGILAANGGESGHNNRVKFLPWSETVQKAGPFNNYASVLNWMNTDPYSYGCTYHGRALQGALKAAQDSVADGRIPVVIYLSDFAAHARIKNSHEYYFNSNDVADLNDIALVYPVCVYPDSRTQSPKRMFNLCDDESHHKFMGDDPGNLMTLFNEIVTDAVKYIDANIKIEDELSSGLQTFMESPEQKAVWSMKDGDPDNASIKLENGKLYLKTFTYHLKDDEVAIADINTNGNVYALNNGTELNKITDSPKLKSSVDFTLKLLDYDLEETDRVVSGATFELSENGSNIWNGTTNTAGVLSIPRKDESGNVILQRNKTYVLRETTVNTALAYLPSRTWTLSVDSNGKITSNVTSGENEDTRNMTISHGNFYIWNIGKETVTVPLVPLYVQKIWENAGSQTPQEMKFTILGKNTTSGQTYELPAYDPDTYSNNTTSGYEEIDTLTASNSVVTNNNGKIVWTKKVLVPVSKEKTVFYDINNNTYKKATDRSSLYSVREDDLTVSNSAVGVWESVAGESDPVVQNDNYVEVTKGYWETKGSLGATAKHESNKPDTWTDYRFEIRIKTNDTDILNKITDITALKAQFKVNGTKDQEEIKHVEMYCTFNKVTPLHGGGYLHIVHVALPWSGLNNSTTTITPQKLIVYGPNTDSDGCVLYDSITDPNNTINYMATNLSDWFDFINGIDYNDAGNDHRLRQSEIVKVYHETSKKESSKKVLSIPVVNMTNTFVPQSDICKVILKNQWSDETIDSTSTDAVETVTYKVDDDTVTVEKGVDEEITIGSGDHTIKQISFTTTDGKTIQADDSGAFAAYSLQADNSTFHVDNGGTVTATFANSRKQVEASVQTTFDPENNELNNIVFPVEITYGREASQMVKHDSKASEGVYTLSFAGNKKLPSYSIDGTETSARVKIDEVIELINSDTSLNDSEKKSLINALHNYETRVNIEKTPASGEPSAIAIKIQNVLGLAPVLVSKKWDDDTVDGNNTAKAKNNESVTVQLFKNGETTPIIPDGETTPDIVLNDDNNWKQIVYVPIQSKYTAKEVKIGNQTVENDSQSVLTNTGYAVDISYPINAEDGQVDISQSALTRNGAAVMVTNTYPTANVKAVVWNGSAFTEIRSTSWISTSGSGYQINNSSNSATIAPLTVSGFNTENLPLDSWTSGTGSNAVNYKLAYIADAADITSLNSAGFNADKSISSLKIGRDSNGLKMIKTESSQTSDMDYMNTIYCVYYVMVPMTVTKLVTGSYSDLGRSFTFELTVPDARSSDRYTWKKNGQAQTVDLSAGSTFMLGNNETATIDLPAGMNITLKETDADGYETTFSGYSGLDGNQTEVAADHKTIFKISSSVSSAGVTFTNSIDNVVPSGENKPNYTMMMIAVVMVLIAAYVAYHLRHRGQDI